MSHKEIEQSNACVAFAHLEGNLLITNLLSKQAICEGGVCHCTGSCDEGCFLAELNGRTRASKHGKLVGDLDRDLGPCIYSIGEN